MFLEFDFVGVPSIKNNPILTFDFHPSWDPRGTRGALGVCRIKKLNKTENNFSKCQREKKVNFDVIIAPQGCLVLKRCIIPKVDDS